ncbi:hypothetical protein PG991_015232 [Apiospora marii]|uniref:Uncharacterized protein n=1 Tax=Apiospora marii TaxID=335849 RepID=A0ABR1R1S8_9PEZI
MSDCARDGVPLCPRAFGGAWSKALFCVHLLSRAGWLNRWRHDCTSGTPWEAQGLDSNFLVHLVEQEVQRLLNTSPYGWWRVPYDTQYAKLVELVTSASESSTSHCVNPSCRRRLRCRVSRRAPCSDECRVAWKSLPLAVRLSPLIRDPSVLDLLCTLAMAELDRTCPGPQLSPGPFPLDPVRMRAALDSLPPMEPGVTVSQLLGSGAGRAERELVLTWISVVFEGMLVPTPASAAVPNMPGPGSFLLLNTHEPRQARFQARLRGTRYEGGGGIAAFHGTPPHNLLRILCDGLRGDAVYYSSEPAYSAWFISYRAQVAPGSPEVLTNNPQTCRGWRNSRYRDVAVLFGVEVAGPPPNRRMEEGNAPADAVMVRYLFVLPKDRVDGLASRRLWNPVGVWMFTRWVRGGQIAEQMRRSYRRIHDGTLVSEIEDGIRARYEG